MNIKNMVFYCTFALCIADASAATSMSDRFSYEEGGNKFEAEELSVDLAGIMGTRDRSDFSDDNSFGFGIGVNYFITRNIGVGADTYLDEFDWPNHIDFSGIARLPIQDTGWSPYALAGVGRQYRDVSQWTAHLGGGVEYRWNPMTGVFLEVRRIFADESPDLSLWRLGVRVRF